MEQLPQERLALAIGAVAAMERAVEADRRLHQRARSVRQENDRVPEHSFTFAERKTEAVIARVFIDWCIARHIAGDLDTVTASMAKWWCTQKQVETDRRMRAVAWRLRLHAGVPDRADVRRRARPEDLWRHQRDHEAVDFALAVERLRKIPGLGSPENCTEVHRTVLLCPTERRAAKDGAEP